MSFDVNTKAQIELTAKLGKLHRSALPVAVRGTLNDAAFEAKKNIPESASRQFVTRKRGFFRAFSSVNKAGGFSINSMSSSVGINSAKGSRVAEGLEAQEKGGQINGRKLIPHDKGRVSNSNKKVVRRKNKLSSMRIGRPGQRGKKVNYLLIKKGGKGTVFEIKQTGRKSKLTPVYHYRNKKVSNVKASPFMKRSSEIARRQIPQFYLKNAERQFKRLLK